MSDYRRPWWLMVNKPPGLVTTIREENRPGQQVFVIRGEPVIQGLVWLTWGPVVALVVVLLLTWLAISFEVKSQGGAVQGLFVVAFFVLPAVGWGGLVLALRPLVRTQVRAEREAESRQCTICLDQEQGVLIYQNQANPTGQEVAYSQIRRTRLANPIGEPAQEKVCLILETDGGPITLLDEQLGSRTQKSDLANRIETAWRHYK